MRFSWDPKKAASNLKRHQVGFAEAVTVLENPLTEFAPDTEHGKTKVRASAEPGVAAMREMPEFDFSKSTGRGGEGLRKALELMRASKRGRPRKDSVSRETQAKSVRLPAWAWEEIARRAKMFKTTDNAVLRDVIASWLEKPAKRRRSRKAA